MWQPKTAEVLFGGEHGMLPETEEYVRRGASGVIQKPFDPMTLPQEIQRILGTAR